ncbi:hypothetical protein TNCV_3059331 [Trichonephila clavipes]|nr:hypothetical protein TNCV_3059331 [Trichonephila clavipes]
MSENDEDVNVEDTILTPKITLSQGLKAVETALLYFEQDASKRSITYGSGNFEQRLSDEDYARAGIPTSTPRQFEAFEPRQIYCASVKWAALWLISLCRHGKSSNVDPFYWWHHLVVAPSSKF